MLKISILKYCKKFVTILASIYLSVEIEKWKKSMKIFPLKNDLQLQIQC